MNSLQKRKSLGYWTKERCHEEALKYQTKRNFKINSGGAYYASKKNGWYNEICLHIKEKVKPHNYWTKKRCREESLKYNTRMEFCINSNVAYCKSLTMEWDGEICSHMIRLGNKENRCIYVYEFSDNCAYVGLTYNLIQRNNNRKLKKNDAVTKHIFETKLEPILKQLTEYIPTSKASLLENEYIEKYRGNEWVILNRIKGGTIGGALKWNFKKCREEALKYNTRTDFKKGNGSAYKSAKRHGWFDKICSHMIIKQKHWTIKEVKIEALKYSGRFDFYKHSMAAYTWAYRKKILNEICQHMFKK